MCVQLVETDASNVGARLFSNFMMRTEHLYSGGWLEGEKCVSDCKVDRTWKRKARNDIDHALSTARYWTISSWTGKHYFSFSSVLVLAQRAKKEKSQIRFRFSSHSSNNSILVFNLSWVRHLNCRVSLALRCKASLQSSVQESLEYDTFTEKAQQHIICNISVSRKRQLFYILHIIIFALKLMNSELCQLKI